MLRVVDENVLVVANDLTKESLGLPTNFPDASEECRISCAEYLRDIAENGRIILDSESEYFDKYRNHASFSGQPGVGDMFLRMVYERGYVSSWATRITIRDEKGYLLPDSFTSSPFDNDDYLWVAGAYNATSAAEIANACDSDYDECEDDLNALGVRVNQLCAGR
ncbi:hypothetical protein H5V43_08140 [Sphingobium fuliginis]|jgi:hypothetical protein|uniref:Uncharacterized protein n=1 Tax=Sphingobium fuliginis (strain ATCC 27551) TaxID=336203 RepID=A0A7M2GBS7_SPHSA|nr:MULTISPECIES: hypothetical protein [Sphingobium]QOT70150.1 hypothetical protein H5V43_08140 [Sphingobium fuliginis]